MNWGFRIYTILYHASMGSGFRPIETVVLAIGAANLLLRRRGPFGRLVVVQLLVAFGIFAATGFLTSLPPASGT